MGDVTALHVPGTSPVHRLAPQCKLAGALAFVLVVVTTPREQVWAYGVYAVVLAALVGVARLPPLVVVRRLGIEVPFVVFALLLPVVAGGDRVDVGPVALSADGLWAAWSILAKGTLGVGTTVVVTATTPLPELVRGLARLRLPPALVAITTFMLRYAAVLVAEARRMKVAREARGHDPRWIWQAGAIAHTAGTLFIRSYERGERVHLAMLSRGYDGAIPPLDGLDGRGRGGLDGRGRGGHDGGGRGGHGHDGVDGVDEHGHDGHDGRSGPGTLRRDWLVAATPALAALVVATAAWTGA